MACDEILVIPACKTGAKSSAVLPNWAISRWTTGAELAALAADTGLPMGHVIDELVAEGYGVYRRPDGRDYAILVHTKNVCFRTLDAVYAACRHPTPHHGMPWTEDDIGYMLKRYKEISLLKLAEELGRKPDAVLFKLEKLRRVERFCVGSTPYCAIFPEQYEPTVEVSPNASRCNPAAGLQQTSKSDAPWLTSESTLQPQPRPQEPEMGKPNIEIKTFIRGVDASTLSDDQIIGRIIDLEAQVQHLKTVKVNSSKVESAIQGLESDIQALANYLDNR